MNEFHPVQLCFLNTPRLYERFVARIKALDPLYHDARLTHLHFEVPPHPILNPTRLERRNHFWEIFCKPHPQTDRCAFIENLHEKVVHQQQRILKLAFLSIMYPHIFLLSDDSTTLIPFPSHICFPNIFLTTDGIYGVICKSHILRLDFSIFRIPPRLPTNSEPHYTPFGKKQKHYISPINLSLVSKN